MSAITPEREQKLRRDLAKHLGRIERIRDEMCAPAVGVDLGTGVREDIRREIVQTILAEKTGALRSEALHAAQVAEDLAVELRKILCEDTDPIEGAFA